jgi:hypothetical protein
LCRLGFIDNQAIWSRARGFISGVAFFHSLIFNLKLKISNRLTVGIKTYLTNREVAKGAKEEKEDKEDER